MCVETQKEFSAIQKCSVHIGIRIGIPTGTEQNLLVFQKAAVY